MVISKSNDCLEWQECYFHSIAFPSIYDTLKNMLKNMVCKWIIITTIIPGSIDYTVAYATVCNICSYYYVVLVDVVNKMKKKRIILIILIRRKRRKILIKLLSKIQSLDTPSHLIHLKYIFHLLSWSNNGVSLLFT